MDDVPLQHESLSAVGKEVLKGFAGLPKHLDPDFQIKALNEKQRFELWASSLGLYHAGHSSLDYRFRDSPPLRQYTLGLLIDLKETLAIIAEGAEEDNLASDAHVSNDESDYSDDEDLSSYPPEEIESEYLCNISITIDRLYALSFKIRNPTMRTGLSRALSYTQVDPRTGVNLIAEVKKWDLSHMMDVFLDYSSKWKGVDLEEHFLVQRLAAANTRRRQQFKYWEKRKVKYENGHRLMTADPDSAGSLFGSQTQANGLKDSDRGQLSDPTTATRIAGDITSEDDSVGSRDSGHEDGSASQDTNVVPAPPEVGSDDKEFECPYCFIICDRKTLHPKAWEKHIIRDLRPYVCTFQNCKDADQQYDTVADWISHQASNHSYGSGNRRKCPICLDDKADAQHIAGHLRRIACFSLPRLDHPTDSSAAGTGGHADRGEVDVDEFRAIVYSLGILTDPMKTIYLVSADLGEMAVELRPDESTEDYIAKRLRACYDLTEDTSFTFRTEDGTETTLEYDHLENNMTIVLDMRIRCKQRVCLDQGMRMEEREEEGPQEPVDDSEDRLTDERRQARTPFKRAVHNMERDETKQQPERRARGINQMPRQKEEKQRHREEQPSSSAFQGLAGREQPGVYDKAPQESVALPLPERRRWTQNPHPTVSPGDTQFISNTDPIFYDYNPPQYPQNQAYLRSLQDGGSPFPWSTCNIFYAHAEEYGDHNEGDEGHEIGDPDEEEEASRSLSSLVNPGHPDSISTQGYLDPRYVVQSPNYFAKGKVFSILWHETDGRETAEPHVSPGPLFRGRYGEVIYSTIRLMVVFRAFDQYSWCFSISTYGGRGVAKPGVDPSYHAIIHMSDTEPRLGSNEPQLATEPLTVDPARLDERLHPKARLNFGERYRVEHDVKVLPIGEISERSMPKFMSYARMSERPRTGRSRQRPGDLAQYSPLVEDNYSHAFRDYSHRFSDRYGRARVPSGIGPHNVYEHPAEEYQYEDETQGSSFHPHTGVTDGHDMVGRRTWAGYPGDPPYSAHTAATTDAFSRPSPYEFDARNSRNQGSMSFTSEAPLSSQRGSTRVRRLGSHFTTTETN